MLIQTTTLSKTYTTGDLATPVLFDVSLTIERGEFVAIMGPSGSGKSTLMHILGFLDTGTGGTYSFDGRDVSRLTDLELARMRNERVGFVFQAFHLLPRTTVLDNVKLPLLYRTSSKNNNRNSTHSIIGRYNNSIPPLVGEGEGGVFSEGRGANNENDANANDAAQNAIDQVGLTHRANHLPNQLSGGEKQRVAIARAIVNNPDVIFADEPTGNLDSKSGAQILSILQSLNDAGHTIIMVTHERDTAAHAKRIIQMRDGRIIADMPNDEWRGANGVLEK